MIEAFLGELIVVVWTFGFALLFALSASAYSHVIYAQTKRLIRLLRR